MKVALLVGLSSRSWPNDSRLPEVNPGRTCALVASVDRCGRAICKSCDDVSVVLFGSWTVTLFGFGISVPM